MHDAAVEHTLLIFRRLYDLVCLVVPKDVQEEMQEALDQLENNYSLTLEELEDTMIVFGKKVWPYRKAFVEFALLQEGKVGEKLLRSHLSSKMKKRFDDFIKDGGSLRELHAGRSVNFFTSEERSHLCEALVELAQAIRAQVVHDVHSTRKKEFMDRVLEFSDILEDLEHRLDSLRIMADAEQEHPQLAGEIRDQVRGFELGMCALGPEISYEALCSAPEHFEGRKVHLKKKRPIHK